MQKMKLSVFALAWSASVVAAHAESLTFVGTSARNPFDYRVGEEMTFTVTLVDRDAAQKPVTGRRLTWKRQGDDGRVEQGTATSDRPLVVKTRSDRPGFVRLTVNVLDAQGKEVRDPQKNRAVVWDGGAGADVWDIARQPIPADFDAFWDARLAKLRATPAEATVTPLASRSDKVFFAKFSVPMAEDASFPAQGLVAYPKAAKDATLPMEVAFAGYGRPNSTTLDESQALKGGGRILLAFTSQGEDPCGDAAYYDNFRTNVCKDFCFRNNGGAPEETDYVKMLLRHARALQWAKTLPAWNGRDILTRGGSMGGYQALGVAALDPDVSRVSAFIPWCADLAGWKNFGRLGGWAPGWTPALDYVSLAHLATRVTCPVTMTIGLGDYVCPPSGEVILYANLRGPKKMTVKQNMGHGSEYGPDVETFALSSDEGTEVRRVSLDGAWRFRKTAGKGAGGWTDVTVPHDWSIAGPFNPDESGWTGKLPWKGAGEYARTFALADAQMRRLKAGDARAYLEFDGVR